MHDNKLVKREKRGKLKMKKYTLQKDNSANAIKENAQNTYRADLIDIEELLKRYETDPQLWS